MRSIKYGKAYVCKFRWRDRAGNDRPTVDIQDGPPVTAELRAVWGIPENGTRVEFRLRDDVPVPQFDKLARDIENFYILRPVTSRTDREVALRVRYSDGRSDERALRYVPPAAAASTRLGDRQVSFEYDGYTIDARAELYAYESALVQGERNLEEREGGLLVTDEDGSALDLTLFAYDEDPGAARLYGHLELVGAGALIRAKLNSPQPEEILTETRDGFDRKHDFFRVLRSEFDPWLKPFVEAERERLGGRPSGLSDQTRKRHDRAFSRLNNLYKQLLGQTSGPGPGPEPIPPHIDSELEFRVPQMTIPTSSSRHAQLLVNTALVAPGSTVEVVSSESSYVLIGQMDHDVPESPSPAESTVVISIRLEALREGSAVVTASCAGASTSLSCTVVDEEVPDLSAGLAFYPDTLELREGERGNLVLFADLQVIGSAGQPLVSSANPNIEVLTQPPRWDPVTAFVVKARVPLIGHGKGEESWITARTPTAEAVALVRVISKRQQLKKGGAFKGFKFVTLPRRVQAYLDADGYVLVNLSDPANAFHFGITAESATKAIEELAASQTLLAQLVLNECIQRAVTEAYQKGKLRTRFPEDPTTDIRTYIADLTYELGGDIHRLFVTARR